MEKLLQILFAAAFSIAIAGKKVYNMTAKTEERKGICFDEKKETIDYNDNNADDHVGIFCGNCAWDFFAFPADCDKAT